MSGIFITFEGIDGAGKSTHIKKVQQLLEPTRRVTLTREPGGTLLAEKIRQLLLTESMDAMTEALLMFAARRDHLEQLIKPALARNEIVLSDRFTDASFAYQGYGRQFDEQVLAQLQNLVQQDPQSKQMVQPDLTFWFDVPIEIARQRVAKNGNLDRFEQQPAKFFQLVAAGYQKLAQLNPQRIVRIDAVKPVAQVSAQIVQTLQQRNII